MAWQFWRQEAAQNTSGNSRSSNMPQSPAMDEDKLRTVARRRLIGAAVLVGLTVLIFPWVFKQQPRPLNDDLIIEVPRKEAAKPWANSGVSSVAPAASTTQAAPKPAVVAEPTPVAPAATEPEAKPDTKPDKPSTANASTSAAVAAAAGAAAAVIAKPASPPAKPAADVAKPAVKPESKPAPKAEAKPAESKPEATAQAGRFVVQVAAFSDANKARDTRIKLEAQGYKTYSQAIDSPKGKVWRVRVGPYGDKAEAEKAKAQLSGKGFTPALLEL
jgi:DedD protein